MTDHNILGHTNQEPAAPSEPVGRSADVLSVFEALASDHPREELDLLAVERLAIFADTPQPCMGKNCGTTNFQHSEECLQEASKSQGWEYEPPNSTQPSAKPAVAAAQERHIEDAQHWAPEPAGAGEPSWQQTRIDFANDVLRRMRALAPGMEKVGPLHPDVALEMVDKFRAAITATKTVGAREGDNEFKNFHRLLCERFGYRFDPVDWKRDQASLIEYIDQLGDAREHLGFEKASDKSDAHFCGYARVRDGKYELAGMRDCPIMRDGELHPIYTGIPDLASTPPAAHAGLTDAEIDALFHADYVGESWRFPSESVVVNLKVARDAVRKALASTPAPVKAGAPGAVTWQPIAEAPTSEVRPFLVKVPAWKMGGVPEHILQVSRFEGNLYPDHLGDAIDREDAVTRATHWMPLAAQGAPVMVEAAVLTDEELNEIYRASFKLIDGRMVPQQIAFCRAIIAAAATRKGQP